MKKIVVLVVTFYSCYVSSQEIINYEEIAFNFFRKEIVSKEFPFIKKILFDNHIVVNSHGYSHCMPLTEDDTIAQKSIIQFIPDHKIKLKFTFFETYFISKNKKAKLFVYNAYPDKNNVIVCLVLFVKSYSLFYTIKINKFNKEIIEYCKTELIS